MQPTRLVAIVGCLVLAIAAQAGEVKFDAVGVRTGYGAVGNDNAFLLYEAFGKVRLPWRWEWNNGWGLQPGLDFSAGVLQRSDQAGFIGQLGPNLTLGSEKFPLAFEVGSNPTVLSREEFHHKDLGCWFQFTSYAGARLRLGRHFDLGYRFQHTSNAGIGDPNPGLNMHIFSAAYRF
jgi:hypothetical protein